MAEQPLMDELLELSDNESLILKVTRYRDLKIVRRRHTARGRREALAFIAPHAGEMLAWVVRLLGQRLDADQDGVVEVTHGKDTQDGFEAARPQAEVGPQDGPPAEA